MMLRAVARVVFPLTFAAALCLPCMGQKAAPAPSAGGSNAQSAPTLTSSTSLDSYSNDVSSLYGTPVEQIIARVNDQVITNSDYARAQTELAQESRQNNWSLEQYNQSEKTLLRDLIDQQLLLSKGKQLGITGDTELIKRLDDIRKQNHLASLDDLEKAVEQQGTSYADFKANIRNNIITQEVVRNEVGSKLQISQAEIVKYYNEHQDSFTQPESIHLSEILVPTPENANDSQLSAAEAKAKDVEAKLKAGGNFADLAKQYSGGPTAQEGGELGEFKRGALARVLEDKTFDLPVGGYTQPIRTRQGYIILKVTAHNPGGTPPLQKVEPQIEQAIYMEKIAPAVREYLTRLRTEAYIDIRPGYTDAGASPNETKPTYTAYVPPQPKRKKKKKRFDKRIVRYGRLSDQKRNAAVASAAAPASPTASTIGASAAAPPQNTRAHFRRVHEKHTAKHKHKNKRVKLRYGRPPATPVSAEQIATAEPPPAAAAPTGVVQPLGPDLEHTPQLTQPKEKKWRFSDEARHTAPKTSTRSKKHRQTAKKVKRDNATPTPLTPTEAANQKVESAPLGLDGDTTKKPKKKKIKVRHGQKTRLGDEKKNNEKENKQPGTEPSSNGSGTASSGSSPAAQ